MRVFFEGFLLILAVFFVVRWVVEPSGPYEPLLAGCFLLIAILDYWYRIGGFARNTSPGLGEHTSVETVVAAKNREGAAKPVSSKVLPRYTWASTSVFFAERFSSAFPGTRSTTWFIGQDAVDRLKQLLREPLTFSESKDQWISPLWWFGRGNLQVEHFREIDARTVLLGIDELRIGRVGACYSENYRRLWVYIEAESMQPTGLYSWTPESMARSKKQFGYVWEEYGLYASKHKVTRAEYDDGHAVINGVITEISGNVELRARYLTPYNLILCPHDSPINNSEFDNELVGWLNRLLDEPALFPALQAQIAQLPIQRELHV